MAGDAFDSGSQGSATGRIAAGPYVLKVGDPAGMTLEVGDPAGTMLEVSDPAGTMLEVGDPAGTALVAASSQTDSRALRRAIARDRKRKRRTPSAAIEGGVDDASAVTSKLERAVSLCIEIASGRLDIESVSDEADALIGLLARLDRAERWQEALRVARCLSVLLALIGRWIELLRSLRIALHAAEELGDQLGQAWALHEQGTLHLAAGRHADADRLLGRAREIRERCGDRRGLAVTERNLQVLCRTLRRLLHRRGIEKPLWPSPALAALAAATLIVLGGTAGAVIDHASSSGGSARSSLRRASVTFAFTPGSPHAGQRVVFTATAVDPRDPPASYTWRWGDGDPASHRVQSHVYQRPHTYTAVLIVRDSLGRTIGRASHRVVVQPPTFPGPNADFSFQPRPPVVGRPVSFDAGSSYDPRAKITNYAWAFGDGQTGHGVTVAHSYRAAKTYDVSLTITDKQGKVDKLTEMVVVAPAGQGRQQAQLGLICPPSSVALGEAVRVSGAITPPRPGATVTVTYVGPSEDQIESSSNAKGFYEARATPEPAGQWSVQSSWAGDEEYLPSTSEPCMFLVQERPKSKIEEEESTTTAESETETTETPSTSASTSSLGTLR